ncbi:hypothetical protein A3C91_00340 [Candidatus Azambacteria bacterium RIFCSPHIGHO2_02_FULL_52_12]|uniref:Polymerase nucleotidyl transferase domain-containing protein n=1 Tax=Candidatus Azambacteria bacterium RIFCSPLOWO2_01_FULL_46_25 TaxID=1797298 RepID=A0A1F5BW32_9BACT|nr:MAG: hypothetical protein A3C91_00340 [Candidatus Azambacteria bacterium RIFCSPHIGHO2_02_FULL_52_12]OGD34816.1 MAG: hypothetical protein A2988_02020 [Candidatus Azambacteria bacterium RIFCSPLOWO2_01_FULL_46_25]OGD36652.1 MAG: hypothetical protein A2850_03950 [Candidatus Azambacteria bacterium RIFCSPHIGHO2_01_FULL_51_74]
MKEKLNAPELERVISQYLTAIGRDIKVSDAFLFGSYAKGKAKADSDIDLCVISPDFGRDDVEEGQYLFKKTIGIDSRIEPVGYSVQSFATEESPLIAEIKRYGRRISKNT